MVSFVKDRIPDGQSSIGAEFPQEFTAVTVILPVTVPAVAVIELETDDPVHPVGNDHV